VCRSWSGPTGPTQALSNASFAWFICTNQYSHAEALSEGTKRLKQRVLERIVVRRGACTHIHTHDAHTHTHTNTHTTRITHTQCTMHTAMCDGLSKLWIIEESSKRLCTSFHFFVLCAIDDIGEEFNFYSSAALRRAEQREERAQSRLLCFFISSFAFVQVWICLAIKPHIWPRE